MRNGKGMAAVFGAAALIAGVCIANSNGLFADTEPGDKADTAQQTSGWTAKPARFDSRFNKADATILPANGQLSETVKNRIRKKYPQDSKILPFEFRAANDSEAGKSKGDKAFWSSLEELKRKRDRHNVHADYEKDPKKSPIRTVQADEEDIKFELTPFEVVDETPETTPAAFEETGSSTAEVFGLPAPMPAFETPAEAAPAVEVVVPETTPLVTTPAAVFGAPAMSTTPTAPTAVVTTTPDTNRVIDSVPAGANPAVSVKWVHSGPINVGQETDCFLVVRNDGKAAAGNVALDAFFPATVKLTKVDPRPENNGEFMTWSFGELAPGTEKRVHVQMIPRERGSLATRAFVRYSGQANGQFVVREPMVKISIKGPERTLVDDPCPHTITVSNPGDGVAHNAVIKVAIPPGLTHRAGDKLVLDAGQLNPGESRDVRLALTASKGGVHPLRAQVTADSGLVDTTETKVIVVAPRLELAITGPKVRYISRKSTYKVRLGNTGTATSNNVRAKYQIPTGFRYVASDKGGKHDPTTNTITWFVGKVSPNESTDFTVQLQPYKLGDYNHQAGATSEAGHACTAQHPTKVEGIASLVLEIVDRDDPLELNGGTVYQIRVSNEGSKAATNVALSCELPTGVRMTNAKGASDHRNASGMLTFGALRSLPPGKTAIYEVEVRSVQAGSHRFRARITSDSIKQPLVADELTQVYSD